MKYYTGKVINNLPIKKANYFKNKNLTTNFQKRLFFNIFLYF
ncbi:hypothetical protein FCR2A7T_28400 [Flavobacterium cauense R2A-7]|nr:hypothetical protein FCR2A7T_28400 [Flavobacterium cauense R2A-7]